MPNVLREISVKMGKAKTIGLPAETVQTLRLKQPHLELALQEAQRSFAALEKSGDKAIGKDEESLIASIQEDFENFYPNDALTPFIPLAARGPWIVSLHGAVIYDVGGYGMLGFGHNPDFLQEILARPQVMANVMTASLAQRNFAQALKKELGHTRGSCPFAKFFCLNSGSEGMTLALRLADAHAFAQTASAPKPIRTIVNKGAFHGRTQFPAQISDSSKETYTKYLASFRNYNGTIAVQANSVEALEQAFASNTDAFIQAVVMEPVLGEGDPGKAVSRAFYQCARELTLKHGALLIVDSVQAGLRTTGALSIVDYPGFENVQAPDIEVYSKALNGGQYPLSVVAISPRILDVYKKGIYGNTMTANPRALDIATAILEKMTPELRNNIRTQGAYFLSQLAALKSKHPGTILGAQGTGLLISLALNPRCCRVSGTGSHEEFMRLRGLNVIHGGQNSLRFTPHFNINKAEIDMAVEVVDTTLRESCAASQQCHRCHVKVDDQDYIQAR